jgi:hypothetical protein
MHRKCLIKEEKVVMRIGAQQKASSIGHKYRSGMHRLAMAGAILALMSGCTTTGTDDGLPGTGTDGVFEITPNIYMIGGLGSFTDFSSTAVKVRFFAKASKFCSAKNMMMMPISSSGKDSAYAQYASAEVVFKCVPK